jgi:hypothetical protein
MGALIAKGAIIVLLVLDHLVSERLLERECDGALRAVCVPLIAVFAPPSCGLQRCLPVEGTQCGRANGKNGSTPNRSMSSTACIVTTKGRFFVL